MPGLPIPVYYRRVRMTAAWGLFALLLASTARAQNARVARCAADGAAVTLSNTALAVTFDITDAHIRPARLENRLSGVDSQLRGELFELKLRDGTILRTSDFHADAPIRCVVAAGTIGAARKAIREPEELLPALRALHESLTHQNN